MELLIIPAVLIGVSFFAAWLIDRFTGGYKRRGNILLIAEQRKKYPEEAELYDAVEKAWQDNIDVIQERTRRQTSMTSSGASTASGSPTPTGSSTPYGQ